ncbi:MAG: VCBS repeat-containing protein, partial [Pseudomonadota bacterium]
MTRTGWIVIVIALSGCEGPSGNVPVETQEPALVETVFVDRAAETGLNFEHFIGADGRKYFPEIMGAGVGVLDYDNDGDLDVFVLQGTQLDSAAEPTFSFPDGQPRGDRLFSNQLVETGELNFTDVTDAAGLNHVGYGMGVATGDFDNDGYVDVYATYWGSNRLYRNTGNGRFADITAGAGVNDERWTTSATWFDYDLDGDLDLALVNYVAFSTSMQKRCTSPTGGPEYCSPSAYLPVGDRLYRNNGDLTFTNVTNDAGLGEATGPGLGIVAADFNGDRWPDVYVANDGAANQLWLNNGDGTFDERGLMSGSAFNLGGTPEASMGLAAGDCDGDGDVDLFMTHLTKETNTLYLNNGEAIFMDNTVNAGLGHTSLPLTGFGTDWFDVDHDGLLDLYVTNGAVTTYAGGRQDEYPYAQPDQLFRNEGSCRFADVSRSSGSALAVEAVGRGVAVGDIDNDGDDDVLVSNNNGPLRLLVNDIGQRTAWLAVRLIGTESNHDGVGARVALLRDGEEPVWRS